MNTCSWTSFSHAGLSPDRFLWVLDCSCHFSLLLPSTQVVMLYVHGTYPLGVSRSGWFVNMRVCPRTPGAGPVRRGGSLCDPDDGHRSRRPCHVPARWYQGREATSAGSVGAQQSCEVVRFSMRARPREAKAGGPGSGSSGDQVCVQVQSRSPRFRQLRRVPVWALRDKAPLA